MGDPPMIRRVAAAQATLDQFRGKAFRLGSNDCLRMSAAHVRRLGYKVKIPAAGSYRTVRSALKLLTALGFAELGQMIDSWGLARIPPAAAIAGDLLMLEAEHPLGGLAIALGNGRVVGYHEDARGADVLQPLAVQACWRVVPR